MEKCKNKSCRAYDERHEAYCMESFVKDASICPLSSCDISKLSNEEYQELMQNQITETRNLLLPSSSIVKNIPLLFGCLMPVIIILIGLFIISQLSI